MRETEEIRKLWRNLEGQMLVDFAKRMQLAVLNTSERKRNNE